MRPTGSTVPWPRTRRALGLAAGLAAGLLVVGWLVVPRGEDRPPAVPPAGGVSPDLAALGEDPDGDGISTADEVRTGTDPLVADIPDVQFSFEDLEFGLRVDRARQWAESRLLIRSEERLDAWHDVRTVGLDLARTERGATTESGGGVGIQAGLFAVPLSYTGRHEQRTVEEVTRSAAAFAFRRERLDSLRQTIRLHRENKQEARIGSHAGYFQGSVRVFSSHPCSLEAFSVNVKVNGRLRWTLPAARDPHFTSLRLGTAPGAAEAVHLRFDGLDTQEMLDHVIGLDGATVVFEVPEATVRLAEYPDPARFGKSLGDVRRHCARVEVVQAGKRRSHFVSTAAGPGRAGIRLEELLGRVPSARPVWGAGRFGDYLAEFAGRPGTDHLDPAAPGDHRWCLFHDGEELDGDGRDRLIRPGGHVRLLHLSSHQYWGGSDWTGYATGYRTLRDLQALEHRFWAELDGYDAAAGRPWDVLTEKTARDQAVAVAARYRQFLAGPVPPAVKRLYPTAEAAAAEFARWFTAGAEIRWPTYTLKPVTARIWWNKDQDLPAPVVTVSAGPAGRETRVESGDFAPDPGNRSGRVRFPADAAVAWSPFDPVELRVRVGSADAVFVRYTPYGSAIGLLQTQELKGVGADPQLSGFQLSAEIRTGDRVVPPDDFVDELTRSRPRVIPVVPAELDPETLALRWWVLHHPVAYYRAGVVFEDLYRAEKAAPARAARLARAVAAYFRAYQFRRCAALAGELPADPAVAPEVLAGLPPGMRSAAELRRLGSLAREVADLPGGSEPVRLVCRVQALTASALRLSYLATDPAWRPLLDTAEARGWRAALIARSGRERAAVARCPSPTIRAYLGERLDGLDAELTQLADQLGP